jgi:tetratricopeptide (TPR) repeat protein
VSEERERPRAALISADGVVRTNNERENLGSPGVVVVTNARVLFVIPDRSRELNLREWSVHYSEIADVSIDRGGQDRVEIRTCDGVEWHCTLSNTDPEVLDAVARHLRWVDYVRGRVLTLETRVEKAADKICGYADSMDWDAAQESYQDVRRSLDNLISAVQITTPMANDTMAPELTDIERTLEEANVRLYIERASSQLELGRYLVEHEDYNRAADVLERARQLHLRAEGQSDAVKRADAFAFGRQRELTEDLERFEWELKTVAAEPVRQANEATVTAEETDDPDTAVEYWETAIRRYDNILDLDWWRDTQEAAEEISDVCTERNQAVGSLIETHTEVASERWCEGVQNQDRGDTTGAIEQFEEAVTHLERAHKLAEEFDYNDDDDIGSKLTEMRRTVESLREDSTTRSGEPGDPESGSAPLGLADTGSNGLPGSRESTRESESEPRGNNNRQPESEPVRRSVDPSNGGDGTGSRLAAGEAESTGQTPVVRLQSEMFTTTERNTERWLPPINSGVSAVDSQRDLTYDLVEIDLPADITLPAEMINSQE